MKDLCLEFLSHRQIDLAANGPLPQGLAFLVAASQQLLLLACLVMPALLLIESRKHGTAHRRILAVIALLLVCAGLVPCLLLKPHDPAGSWGRGLMLFAAAAVIWGASLALLRLVSSLPTVPQNEAPSGELDRLRRLETAIAWSGDGVVIAASAYPGDPHARALHANAAFTKMTGLEAPSTAADCSIPLPDRVVAAVETALRLCLPTRTEVPGRRSDGTAGWAEWHIVPLMSRDAGRREWIAILRDITARTARPDREQPAPICRECNETIDSPRTERTQSGVVRHLRSRGPVM